MRLKCAAAVAFVLAFLTLARAGEKFVPLTLELPTPQFEGTKKTIPLTPYIQRLSDKPRPSIQVPAGTKLLSLEKPVTSSDDEPEVGELDMITDGSKAGDSQSFVELEGRRQWVQIDLEESHAIHAIVVWHYHGESRIYHDVVIQLADDADLITNVRTAFNNDYDNSAGLGIGRDKEYFEDYQGHLLPVPGLHARYVRLYSQGNTSNALNHYVEVEVWGK